MTDLITKTGKDLKKRIYDWNVIHPSMVNEAISQALSTLREEVREELKKKGYLRPPDVVELLKKICGEAKP